MLLAHNCDPTTRSSNAEVPFRLCTERPTRAAFWSYRASAEAEQKFSKKFWASSEIPDPNSITEATAGPRKRKQKKKKKRCWIRATIVELRSKRFLSSMPTLNSAPPDVFVPIVFLINDKRYLLLSMLINEVVKGTYHLEILSPIHF